MIKELLVGCRRKEYRRNKFGVGLLGSGLALVKQGPQSMDSAVRVGGRVLRFRACVDRAELTEAEAQLCHSLLHFMRLNRKEPFELRFPQS